MNATSAHPSNETQASANTATRDTTVLIWDAPVRVFHWLMALCFAGAYATAEGESWRLVHVTLGYTLAGLVAFRIVWGFIGTRHARFSSFVKGPQAVTRYLRSLPSAEPEHHTGHNPAGAWAILGMLALAAAIATTGWMTYNDLAGEWAEELHDAIAEGMLVLVCLHIAAVVASSWLHRENLPRSMVSGHKKAPSSQGIRSTWRSIAVALMVAVLTFWYWQWRDSPSASDRAAVTSTPHH
jgi:cytochrome b